MKKGDIVRIVSDKDWTSCEEGIHKTGLPIAGGLWEIRKFPPSQNHILIRPVQSNARSECENHPTRELWWISLKRLELFHENTTQNTESLEAVAS